MSPSLNWTFERRVMSKVIIDANGCWVWHGSRMRNGYGQISVGGKRIATHKYVYLAKRGPYDQALDLDHLCRNRACCNPDHLEPVTRSENLRRGNVGTWAKAVNGSKTHCPKGHPLSGENLYIHPTGRRCCRKCAAIRSASRRNRASN